MLRLVLSLLFFCAAAPVAAQPHARTELIAESAAPQAGATTTLAIVMTPGRGWHTYWKNPGGAGVETQAAWTLPPGVAASAIRYPVPSTFLVAGIMNYVFEGETALLVTLSVPHGLAAGTPLPITLRLDYLVCDDRICVPESAGHTINLAVGDGARDPAVADRFDRARQALPRVVDWPAQFVRDTDSLRIAVALADADAVTGAYFFPEADGVLDYDAPQRVGRDGDTLVIATKAGNGPPPARIDGVLKLDRTAGALGVAISAVPGEVPADAVPVARPRAALPALVALPFAILGGLLLNIMPCVFPILGLKAMSLARGGVSEAAARREALAYTAGVMLASLALGGGILLLRAAGAEVGWAFQLQDPRVIFVLMLVVTAVAFNLAGLFEIAAPRIGGDTLVAKGGSSGAFWTGILAAVVATPCTGPFMGIALGAAILLPPATGLLIFGGLGLGLALPFLAIGFIPALRQRLPRPGPWLATFRRAMAVPMFAAALALAWVLGRQSGVTGLTLGLGAALLLGLALWWAGLRQARHARLWLPGGLALLAFAGAAAVPTHVREAMPVESIAVLPGSEAFSESRLASLRAAGTPAFVYFTADWCITCKVNERGALSAARVAEAFADAGVVTLVGDWTNADPDITRFLEAQGRAGVPLYLFYGGGDGDVRILPQLLDADTLVLLARGAAAP